LHFVISILCLVKLKELRAHGPAQGERNSDQDGKSFAAHGSQYFDMMAKYSLQIDHFLFLKR